MSKISRDQFRNTLKDNAKSLLDGTQHELAISKAYIAENAECPSEITAMYIRNALNMWSEFINAGKRVSVKEDSICIVVTLKDAPAVKVAKRDDSMAMAIARLIEVVRVPDPDGDGLYANGYRKGAEDLKQAIIRALTGQSEVNQ